MRIALVTGSTSSLPVINWLHNQHVLAGVAIQDVLHKHNSGIQSWLQKEGIGSTIVEKSTLNGPFVQWLSIVKPDIVIVYGFSFIFPKSFFSNSSIGFYNIHFSLLPAYKGPSPLFWQLKNGEKMSGVSIHRMIEKPDSGEVLVQLPYQVGEIDTYGLLHAKLSEMVIPALLQFLHFKLYEGGNLPGKHTYHLPASCQKRPEQTDIVIRWKDMSAFQLRNLVQAANPVYQGACTFYNGMEIRILDVNMVSPTIHDDQFQKLKPGEIIPEANELIVMCCNRECLQVEIVATTFGVMTGRKWKEVFAQTNNQLSNQFNS